MVALPPGPRMPAPVQVLTWGMRPCAFLEGCLRRYGDAFTLRLLGFGERGFSNVVFLTQPDAIKAVFTGGSDRVRVGELRAPMAPMFGPASILLLDGAQHMRQRKLLLPPFHGARMHRFRDVMSEVAERELARWPLGEPVRSHTHMQAVTLEVIMRAVFGIEEGERLDRCREALR